MSKYKLLLADDSITIQKVVNLTFADEGIEVISVGDGNSALEKFSEFIPDLVMADINMPGLNGYEICERIKQNEQTRQIPVILLVGSFEPFDENRARQAGADDYLTKPFQSIRQLVNKVSTLLESAGQNQRADEFAASAGSGGDFAAPQSVSEENYRTQASSGEQLGDAGMDDEMIQTNQGGFAFDETQKFSSKSDFEEDYGKTQPLSAEELDQINSYPTASFNAEPEQSEELIQDAPAEALQFEEQRFVNEESSSVNEDSYQPDGNGAADAPPLGSASEPVYQSYQNSSDDAGAAAGDWDLDEMNLLELPPRKFLSKQTDQPPVQEEIAPTLETPDDPQETVGETTETNEEIETGGWEEANENLAEPSENLAEPSENLAETSENLAEIDGNAVVVAEAEMPEYEEPADNLVSEVADDASEQQQAAVAAAAAPETNLSEGDIDAIAQKVADKISDRVVRELAPQIADLLVRRMAEERLRE